MKYVVALYRTGLSVREFSVYPLIHYFWQMLFSTQSNFIITGSVMIQIVCRRFTGTQSLTPKIMNREHGSNWRGPPADGWTDKWKDRKRMIMSTSQQHLQMGTSLAVCQYISLEPQQSYWSHWQLQPNTFLGKFEPWVDRCIVVVILMGPIIE